MAVRVGHAVASEYGNVHGEDGNQNGKELRISEWYNGNWDYVLRPKNSTLAEKSVKICKDACNNKNIGYSQYCRNTLYSQALRVNLDLSKIQTPCACDCSALQHVISICAGSGLSYGSNGLTTSTMVNAFVGSGNYEKLSASKYLTSDEYLKAGDVLVKEGSHTLMVLEDGSKVIGESKTKIEYAKNKSNNYNKKYTTTSDLNLRTGAGSNKNKITVIPKGATVRCYGYYTNVDNTPWLYVVYDKYKGFCSSKYLK